MNTAKKVIKVIGNAILGFFTGVLVASWVVSLFSLSYGLALWSVRWLASLM